MLVGIFTLLAASRAPAAPADPITDLRATPAALTLVNPQRPHSLIVQARTKGGYDLDHTATATDRSATNNVNLRLTPRRAVGTRLLLAWLAAP